MQFCQKNKDMIKSTSNYRLGFNAVIKLKLAVLIVVFVAS